MSIDKSLFVNASRVALQPLLPAHTAAHRSEEGPSGRSRHSFIVFISECLLVLGFPSTTFKPNLLPDFLSCDY